MPDLAHTALRVTLMSVAVVCCGVIALILIDCLCRIAFGFGVMP